MIEKIMFDSNTFDKLIDSEVRFKKSNRKFDIYITAVQIEELSKIPDSKIGKRTRIFLLLCNLQARLVMTPAVFDCPMTEGYYCFASEDSIYENLLKEDKNNINDALIGTVAKQEGCTLVTEDIDFQKRLKNNNVKCMNFDTFIA